MLTKEQIQEWVENYSDDLYRYIIRRVKDDALAKDLVQETFLAAYKSRSQYSPGSNPMAWLYTIIKNKMIDHYRSEQRKPTDSLDDQPHIDAVLFDSKGNWRHKPSSHFFSEDMDLAEKNEFWKVLGECQNDLSSKQKLAFIFKYDEGWESNRICKELNISSSNYWVLIHRAKLKLRECLETKWMNV
ncbi:MAG: sigma-70 family RNA polymerase sigma factor [Bacteroidetes bacterium]|jgi:RNA polymerase sigma-70 factor (ECF subfamily)|nr:sigma-70 family RNA polymerase sigma factor [Bacteroidota bacterium]